MNTPVPAGRAKTWNVDAYVAATAVTSDGRTFAAGLGDGTVRIFAGDNPEPQTIQAHNGACLCLVTDADGKGFLSGGDDGKLVRIDASGDIQTITEIKNKWIEHVTTHNSGIRAYAAGKDAFVLDKKSKEPRKLAHAFTVGGLAINEKGKRLAVSHYNGVSLWWLAQDSPPQVLEWKGSHLNVMFSRDGDYVVTALQENALHGWRLSDKQHMRMTGYGAKIRSISFSRKGHVLATGGADTVVCWPFTGGGPMGKPPLEFGGGVAGPGAGSAVTAVLCNPKLDMIAAGFANGAVILGQPGTPRSYPLLGQRGVPIVTLCWNPAGDRLLIGDEGGQVTLSDFRGLAD